MKKKRSASAIAAAMMGAAPKRSKPASKPAAKAAAKAVAKPASKPASKVAAKPSKPASKPGKRGASLDASLDASLERARAAAGDAAATLAALVDAWRALPAIAIADAIDELGARAKAGLEAPSGVTAAARNAAWDAAADADDAAMRGVLLDALTNTKGSADTAARIDRLVAHPDPRTASRIVDLIETPQYNASVSRTKVFWVRVFELLPKLGDARILARARGFADKWARNSELNTGEPEELAKRLARVMPAIEAAYASPPTLPAAAAAQLRAITGALGTGTDATEADLVAAVYAAPDDDHARAVLADFLQERGDPRGEFIALQLANRDESSKRERELLADYQTRWLGPLAKQLRIDNIEWQRGFLASCEPLGGLTDDDPMWATVKTLVQGAPGSDRSHTAALRGLSCASDAQIVQLATLKKPLGVEWITWRTGTSAVLAEHLPRICVLPALRRLEVASWNEPDETVMTWAFISEAPCARHLDELVIPGEPSELATAFEIAERAPARTFALCTVDDWTIAMTRDAAGRRSELVVTSPGSFTERGDRVVEALRELAPDRLTSARVVLPKEDAYKPYVERFQRALDRQKRLAAPPQIEQRTYSELSQ